MTLVNQAASLVWDGLYFIWSMKLTFGDMLKSSNLDANEGDEAAAEPVAHASQRSGRTMTARAASEGSAAE